MNKKQREQRRRAQARYRKVHAGRLARIRTVVNVLQRQRERVGIRDIERLARQLRSLLGAPAALALRAALRQ
jgi:hypothetical protein